MSIRLNSTCDESQWSINRLAVQQLTSWLERYWDAQLNIQYQLIHITIQMFGVGKKTVKTVILWDIITIKINGFYLNMF